MVAVSSLLQLAFALRQSCTHEAPCQQGLRRPFGVAAPRALLLTRYRPRPVWCSTPEVDGEMEMSAAAVAPALPRYQAPVLSRFMSWLVEQGADISPDTLSLEWRPGSGLGLYCLRPVSKDAIVVSLPPSLPLGPTLSPEQWPPALVACGLPSLARLALVLLYEKHCRKGSSSRYGPYLSVLPGPSELRDLPLLWPNRDLRLLGPEPLLQDVLNLRAGVERERRMILGVLQEAAHHSSSDDTALAQEELRGLVRVLREEGPGGEWAWARGIVMSRPYYMEEGEEESLRLLPLLDMLNHGDDVAYAVLPGDGVFADRSSVTLTTDRDYEAGQQLMGTYGRQLSSACKLYSFGYQDYYYRPPPPDTPTTGSRGVEVVAVQGTAFFVVSLREGEEEGGWKAQVLRRRGLVPEGQRFEVPARLEGGGSAARRMVVEEEEGSLGQLMRFLRLKWWCDGPLALAKEEEEEGWWEGEGGWGEAAVQEVLEAVERGEEEARARLQRLDEASRSRVAGVLRLLYEGELGALRAVREAVMARYYHQP